MTQGQVIPYVIRLDWPNRRENVSRVEEYVPGLSIFEAIDTTSREKFEDARRIYPWRDYMRSDMMDSITTRGLYGKLGCHLSHTLLWKMIQDRHPEAVDRQRWFWIMEDDIEPEPWMLEKPNQAIHQAQEEGVDADFIRMFCHPIYMQGQYQEDKRVSETFFRDLGTGFISYLMTRKAIDFLLAHIKEPWGNIDCLDVFSDRLNMVIPARQYLHDTLGNGSARNPVSLVSAIEGIGHQESSPEERPRNHLSMLSTDQVKVNRHICTKCSQAFLITDDWLGCKAMGPEPLRWGQANCRLRKWPSSNRLPQE